jgi:alpha-galactosidase
MAQLVTIDGRAFAVEDSGESDVQPTRHGVILPAGRVAVLHGMSTAEVYRHGQNSWSPCGWNPLDGPPLRIENENRRVTADDPVWDDPTGHHSSGVIALRGEDGMVLLLGALGLDTPRLSADADTVSGWYESPHAGWFLGYGQEAAVFDAYCDELISRFGRRYQRAGRVWCSWYAYYENIDEQVLDKDLADLSQLPFDVAQVDDGWEQTVGDWQPNDRFPSGMRALAARITQAGLRPGLWIAPFIVRPESRLAHERPELILRDAEGAPAVAGYNWGGPYWALDLSLDAARDHIAETIRRVVHDWGFTYLKLDFINAGAAPGTRRTPGTGRDEAYRSALELIREIAGEDTYLLGSGAIPIPSLGVLDAIRTGPDVAPLWDHYATSDPSDALARNALVTTVHRLWQKPLIDLDPDVVYFRSRRSLLSEEQRQALQDLARICGFTAVSDPPRWLDPDERAALVGYLSADPDVTRLGRYRFLIGERVVDFAPVIDPGRPPVLYPVS